MKNNIKNIHILKHSPVSNVWIYRYSQTLKINDMTRTIAILTEKGVPSKEIKEDTLVNVFKVEDGKVIEYESIRLENSDNDMFSKLLRIKEISLIYLDSINHELKRLLNKLGIMFKCREEWNDDKFIEQFVFS